MKNLEYFQELVSEILGISDEPEITEPEMLDDTDLDLEFNQVWDGR